MKLHILSGGRLRMRRSIFYPQAPRGEMLELPVSCGLFKHAHGNVLFDSGCNPELPRDPQGRWGGLAKLMAPVFAPEDTVVHQLPKAGLTPQDIDLVVCSHLHPDHCGCNDHFRRATIMCHAAELTAARADPDGKLGYVSAEWDQPQGFKTFEGQVDLFGDGRVVLIPMPGHTPGSTAALVALDRDGSFLLAADAAPVQAVLDGGYAPKNSVDVDQVCATLDEIRRIQRTATVVFGHDDEQFRTLRTGADFYA